MMVLQPANALPMLVNNTPRLLAPLAKRRHSVACAASSQSSLRTVTATVAPPMLLAGAITGPLLDGIHGTVGLLTYDVLPVTIGHSLHTSATVPVLLSVFYAVVGVMTVVADERLSTDPATQLAQQRCQQPAWTALTAGSVAFLLALSALLYDNGVGYPTVRALAKTSIQVVCCDTKASCRFQQRWRCWACCTGGCLTAPGRACSWRPCVQ